MMTEEHDLSPKPVLDIVHRIKEEIGEGEAVLYQVLENMTREEQPRHDGETSEILWGLQHMSTELLKIVQEEASQGKFDTLKNITHYSENFCWWWTVINAKDKSDRRKLRNGSEGTRVRGFSELRHFMIVEKEHQLNLEVNMESESLKPMVMDLERVFGNNSFPVNAADRSWGSNQFRWENQEFIHRYGDVHIP